MSKKERSKSTVTCKRHSNLEGGYQGMCGFCHAEDCRETYGARIRQLEAEVERLQRLIGDPEDIARRFHETYERLAPQFNYQTRNESAKPWLDVPEKNRALMIAVASEVLAALAAGEGE